MSTALPTNDQKFKLEAAEHLRVEVRMLISILEGSPLQSWLESLSNSLDSYLKTDGHPDHAANLLKVMMEVSKPMREQLVGVEEKQVDVTGGVVDLSAEFAEAYRKSNLPDIFDRLVKLLEAIIKFHALDTRDAEQARQRLIEIIQANRKPDYYATRCLVDLVWRAGKHVASELVDEIRRQQMKRVSPHMNVRKRAIAILHEDLAVVPGIELLKNDLRHTARTYRLRCWRFDKATWGLSREKVIETLQPEGIPAAAGCLTPVYRNLCFQLGENPTNNPCIKRPKPGSLLDYSGVFCPVAEAACTGLVWLGPSTLLAEEESIRTIGAAFRKGWQKRKTLV